MVSANYTIEIDFQQKITIENYLEKLLICYHWSPTNYTIENGFAKNCGAAQILQQEMVSANYTIEIGFQPKNYNRKLL